MRFGHSLVGATLLALAAAEACVSVRTITTHKEVVVTQTLEVTRVEDCPPRSHLPNPPVSSCTSDVETTHQPPEHTTPGDKPPVKQPTYTSEAPESSPSNPPSGPPTGTIPVPPINDEEPVPTQEPTRTPPPDVEQPDTSTEAVDPPDYTDIVQPPVSTPSEVEHPPIPTPSDTDQPPIPTDSFPPIPTDIFPPIPTDIFPPIPTDIFPPIPTDIFPPAPTDVNPPVPTDINPPSHTDIVQPPVETPPVETPPVETPPVETPPAPTPTHGGEDPKEPGKPDPTAEIPLPPNENWETVTTPAAPTPTCVKCEEEGGEHPGPTTPGGDDGKNPGKPGDVFFGKWAPGAIPPGTEM